MVNQWACHTPLTSLWKTLVFNHPLLPTSCGYLTSFAQGLSWPIKTPCCTVKAFEAVYASELEITKATDTTTLGTAKKMQGNIACLWNSHVETLVSAKQNNYFQIWFLRILQDKPWPVLETDKERKERNLENILKCIYLHFAQTMPPHCSTEEFHTQVGI